MPHPLPIISVNIETWCAKSKGLHTQADWLAWSHTGQWPVEGSLEVNRIPAMMRRRMSSLSKLAVQCAIELMEHQSIDYIVFSSRHGELLRSSELIKDIIRGDDASPMAFSQSVHNTAAGLTTIATKQPIPVTSIAASSNTFHSAMIEAWSYLAEYPSHRVLLVDFDEPVPEIYQQYEDKQFCSYSLGLVLTHGDALSIPPLNANQTHCDLPQALSFLQHWLTSTTT
ncbi:beta-ketoacyl synthase chain length factor [Vibrio methylphosphonaticus]|uniref:beta-ketoacyl synthase chain length factor n=1 Tax=Vibrio methylphosphonaticus TaxID=2946866 RepID=UPI002029FDA2|nr:beta-ketoacyl synthase chain length factor [Vibrio methylphosphonaticus]MCL9774243.1 beta-ketoacyl synthase chain length factor [Vibrio methylphosphonaticus]